ncbi:MAG TPA: hypothetical protein VHL85_05110 [Burkholderiales bacterium]|jgi:hypothetical protein|nr:hypothetical protein [Burkholderiales bacterium]
MDSKRKSWREEEEKLIARWNAAAAHYQAVQAEIAQAGGEATSEALVHKAAQARAEMDAVRRRVARLKVEFNMGKRY